MKNFIKALLAFLVLSFVAAFFTYLLKDSVCSTCYQTATTISYENQAALKKANQNNKNVSLTITDAEGNHIISFPDGLLINAKNGIVVVPESMSGFKDSIYTYLKNHQDKELLIKANYLQSEGEKMGIQRAAFLKKVLSQFGINESKIIPLAVLSEYSYDNNGNYKEGIALAFKAVTKDDVERIEKSIAHKVLYSKFGSTDFKPDRTLQAYAVELQAYLAKYPNKNVSVTGHTDNIGDAQNNYQLGLKRAQKVVAYLVSQTIEAKRIKAYSKGENEPIANNNTDEGKAKNRRIVIEIK